MAKLLAENAKFDVVLNSVFVANEMGYYLAHRSGCHTFAYYSLPTYIPTQTRYFVNLIHF